MPNMANITVKASNGTTDVVYVALSGAAGDNSPAFWRVDAALGSPMQKPRFDFRAKWNARKDVRQWESQLVYQDIVLNTTTNRYDTVGQAVIKAQGFVPQRVTPATIDELVAQFANLLKSALVQEQMKSGFAAN